MRFTESTIHLPEVARDLPADPALHEMFDYYRGPNNKNRARLKGSFKVVYKGSIVGCYSIGLNN